MKLILLSLLLFTFACVPSAKPEISEGGEASEEVNEPLTGVTKPKGAAVAVAQDASFVENKVKTEVLFSPSGGCQAAIVGRIDALKSGQSLRILAYGLTNKPIVSAILAAQAREVDVKMVLDKSDVTEMTTEELVIGHVPVFIDSKHVIMHNKVMVFNETEVETGSFNLTANAELRNAENCLFITDPPVTEAYIANYVLHEAHSVLFTQTDAGVIFDGGMFGKARKSRQPRTTFPE